ncbi:hypothetical protein H5410_023379 [Solanum commersonii]|uniref:Uncharacterized protein n=1 Tax=Solanum commersonii TaxID=4109 RepID=A0A9J5ZHD9_SOLCO|nr:hypothetical protein H5410_023379 [Solanum commersonii]
MEIASLVAGRNGHPKLKKNWNSHCDYCRRTGHIRENCYKLIGYPPDFKFRKKDNNPNLVNPRGGDQRNQAYNGTSDERQINTNTGHGRASCVDTYRGPSDKGKGVMPSESYSGGGEFGRYSGDSGKSSGDWHREAGAGAGPPNYSHHQYNQLMHNMEPHHYNQFQRLMDKDNSGGSSSHSHLSDSANMGGNVSVSNVLNAHNTGFLDDMVQANPSNHVEQVAVPIVVNEPAVDVAPPVIARQSTRPRKPPSWMTDFITNAATESTLYPLSQTRINV